MDFLVNKIFRISKTSDKGRAHRNTMIKNDIRIDNTKGFKGGKKGDSKSGGGGITPNRNGLQSGKYSKQHDSTNQYHHKHSSKANKKSEYNPINNGVVKWHDENEDDALYCLKKIHKMRNLGLISPKNELEKVKRAINLLTK